MLGLGSMREPGSGFLSFLAGCFICCMAAIVLVESFLQKKEARAKLSSLWAGVNWRRPLIISFLVLGFILFLERLGFFLSSFLLIFILLKTVEKFSWTQGRPHPGADFGMHLSSLRRVLKGHPAQRDSWAFNGTEGILVMDFLGNMIVGFSVAFQPTNLMFCFLGCFVGTLIGVLPGIGPVGTMAILLPVTYGINPTTAIIMLAGIYYGAQYGGSTTSILVNIPGEAASVITTLDGYQMARQGRAGPALGIAAFGSFIAGTFGVIGLMLLAPPLVSVALRFGPPEYFSLMILGFVVLTYLAQKSMAKALLTAGVGIILGTVGLDTMTGMPRFTFNVPELLDGIGLAPLAMGLFGISEILLNVEKRIKQEVITTNVRGLFPTLEDWRRSIWAILRGTGDRFLPGDSARRGSGPVFLRLLCHGEADLQESRKIRQGGDRRGGGPGVGQQLPPPRARSSPCSPWAFRPTWSWRFFWGP